MALYQSPFSQVSDDQRDVVSNGITPRRFIFGNVSRLETDNRLGSLEAWATGHIRMFAAAGILTADFRADVMDPAFPAILGRNFIEPWTGTSRFFDAGFFPHSIGERVIPSSDTAHCHQDVLSFQCLPAVIICFSELVIVVKVMAAVSALATLESFHTRKQPYAGFV